MAFAIESWSTGRMTDPRYFKFVATLAKGSNSSDLYATDIAFEFHKCTEVDYDKFHPVDRSAVSKVEKMKQESSLYCIDWDSTDVDLYGNWASTANYQAIDIMVVPCGQELPGLDQDAQDIEECVWDKNETL